MTDPAEFQRHRDMISAALQEKLRLRPAPFATLVARSRGRLPRRIGRLAEQLAEAEQMSAHPRLQVMMDGPALSRAAEGVMAHLNKIDLADERKGRWLSLAGSLSFNLIAVVVLLIAVLIWRGYL